MFLSLKQFGHIDPIPASALESKDYVDPRKSELEIVVMLFQCLTGG